MTVLRLRSGIAFVTLIWFTGIPEAFKPSIALIIFAMDLLTRIALVLLAASDCRRLPSLRMLSSSSGDK